jgi:hypothetical protein
MTALFDFASIILETMTDVMPIAATIVGFQVLVIRKPLPHPGKTGVGLIYVILGIAFFLKGLEMTLFPVGELMASQLTSPEFIESQTPGEPITWQSYGWVYLFGACIGFSTTLAEPSLIAVALKAEEISGGAIQAFGLRIAVAVGVAIGLSLGILRIVTGSPLYLYIVAEYCILMVQTAFAPKLIIGLAYDSAGVTTSTVTVPLVTALGLGLASTVPGRDPLIDGFGLIAFASLFPIITVLAYAELLARMRKRSSQTIEPSNCDRPHTPAPNP